MWYETAPYYAYYYTGRYQDVVNLAEANLNKIMATRSLEESWFWRPAPNMPWATLTPPMQTCARRFTTIPVSSPPWICFRSGELVHKMIVS